MPPTLPHQVARAVQGSIVSLEPSEGIRQKRSAQKVIRVLRAPLGPHLVGQALTRDLSALLLAHWCDLAFTAPSQGSFLWAREFTQVKSMPTAPF